MIMNAVLLPHPPLRLSQFLLYLCLDSLIGVYHLNQHRGNPYKKKTSNKLALQVSSFWGISCVNHNI